jgi:polyisoprenoid-binding protein YceI
MKTTMRMLILLIAVSIGYQAAAQTTWKPDAAHTEVQFIAEYMVFSDVTGEFKEFDMTLTTKGEGLEDAMVEFTAQTASITTGHEKRDGHLKSPDFFDVAKYPTITFKATKIFKESDGHYKMVGDLTMHGVTHAVTLDVRHRGTSKDPYGNIKAGYSIRGHLNRYDYGLKWNVALEAGGVLVGEEVQIVCNVTLIQQK